MADKSLFGEIVKMAKKKNDYAFILGEDNPYEVKSWTDTGCYILNAVLSNGDIFKGIIDGKRYMISGEKSTAKSLFTTFIIGAYLKKNPDSYVVFFETEGSSIINMAESVGIPKDRMIIIPVGTVEECRSQIVNLLDKIIDTKEGYTTTIGDDGKKKRKKIKDYKCESKDKFIFCIDSLGMLGTKKETGDIAAGFDTKDMTRAQLLKAFARVTSLKLSIAQTPLIIVNHTYACLTDQTNIRMFDNTVKNISEINIGDKIKIFDDNYALVKDTCKYENVSGLVELIDECGNKITCTPNHKFLISNKDEMIWKETIDIQENDEILTT